MAQIAPKASELIPLLGEMYGSNVINEFTIRRAQNEADKLLKNGFLDGHVIHALVDSLILDADGFFEHFKIVQSNSTDLDDLTNMAKSLLRLGYSMEAYTLTESLLKQHPDDISLCRFSLSVSLHVAKFSTYLSHLEALNKLGQKNLSLDELNISNSIKNTLQLMSESHINESDFEDVVLLANEIIRAKKLAFRGINIEGGREGHISIKYGVDTDVDGAVETSFEIADAIVSKLQNTYCEILTVGCYSDDV